MDLKDLPFLFDATQCHSFGTWAGLCQVSPFLFNLKVSFIFLARGPAFSDTAPPFLSQEGQMGIFSWFYIDNIEIEQLLCYYLTVNKK